MVNLDSVRPEDLGFVELRQQPESVNGDGIVNEPVLFDTRTDKPYEPNSAKP